MPVTTLEGIIVKRTNFGEADRILTLITPFKGKITVIAKGVRRITSRRGGNVELLNKVKFQMFQGSGLPILTEAESLETFQKIKSDLILSAYGTYIAELSEKFLPENQPNQSAYQLINAVLNLLETNPRQIFIRAFEIKLLSVLGFWSLNQIAAEGSLKELLDKLQKYSWEEISQINVSPEEALEVERILRYYLEKVLEAPLKSMQVIKDLKPEKI